VGRFVLRHERFFLTTFLVAGIAVCAIASWMAFRDGDTAQRVGMVVAAAVGLAGTAVHQFVLWRRGEFIVLDPEQRERNRERNTRTGIPVAYALVGAFLIAAVVLEDLRVLILPLLGGATLGITPGLLWVAWVVRPDEQEGRGFTAS
jgi:hypothetical protein